MSKGNHILIKNKIMTKNLSIVILIQAALCLTFRGSYMVAYHPDSGCSGNISIP